MTSAWMAMALFWFFMWVAARRRADKAEKALANARRQQYGDPPPQSWY